MYLEISNVAAALGKNPYESFEKTLLVSWARHCPNVVKDYLISNKCILLLKDEEESFSELQKEVYSDILPKQFDVKDFSKIEENIISEYKRKRNNEQTETEIVQLKQLTQDSLKKDNGNLQETNLIKKEQYVKGNDKMYYYNVTSNGTIGGKHDASVNGVLLEIKTRVKKQNVRRNEYDLYQLICYLLATRTNCGKIVQVYNNEKFDSDVATENEYGLIDITKEPWINLKDEIVTNLMNYFIELSKLIKTSNYIYLSKVIPKSISPIAKYYKDGNKFVICEENVKFKNLFRHLK